MTGFSHHNARVNQNKWSRARTSLYLRYLSLSELFLGIKVFLNFRVAGCLPNVRTLKVPHVPHFYGWLPTALKACTSLPDLFHTKCVQFKKVFFSPTPVISAFSRQHQRFRPSSRAAATEGVDSSYGPTKAHSPSSFWASES